MASVEGEEKGEGGGKEEGVWCSMCSMQPRIFQSRTPQRDSVGVRDRATL